MITTASQSIPSCEAEPLQFSACVQPFGGLLRVDDQGIISHVSTNVPSLINIEMAALLGRSITAAGLQWLTEYLNCLPYDAELGHAAQFAHIDKDVSLDINIIATETGRLIEIEPYHATDQQNHRRHFQLQLLRVPSNNPELEAYHQLILTGIQTITGLNRLMVYQFHEDWSGEVIAELVDHGFGSYLGLRFPASDIPANARQLYLLNPFRSIPDITAPAVPVKGINTEPLDLSRTDLRSVSPIHLEYLNNMGVAASYSLPITINNQLWGLIVGHHFRPLLLPSALRHVCATLVKSYAMGLRNYLSTSRTKMSDQLDRKVVNWLNCVFATDNPLDNIEKNSQQMTEELFADGFAAIFEQEAISVGAAPDLTDLARINDWLNQQPDYLLSTSCLPTIFPYQPLESHGICGMLALKADSARYGLIRFFWFRGEEKQEIAWGGNPNKPIVKKSDVISLSPRRSFEKWIEIHTGYSRPWREYEKLFATKIRAKILRY